MKEDSKVFSEVQFINKVESIWEDMIGESYSEFKCPTVECDTSKRLTSSLGMAYYVPMKLRFSYRLLDGRFMLDDIEAIIKHEIGHLLAYYLYGECQGHNSNFKALGDEFGFNSMSSVEMRRTDRSAQIEEIEGASMKYRVECPSCKKRWYKGIGQELTSSPELFMCMECGHEGLECFVNNG